MDLYENVVPFSLIMVANNVNSHALRIVSYNCREYLSRFSRLLRNSDILFLHEHWLCSDQLNLLNDVSSKFCVGGVSGFDNREVLRASRPSLWWRSYFLEQGVASIC